MTSSPKSSQKALRKRLNALVRRSCNRTCCDCPEKAPTWGSLLVPPKDAPSGSKTLVAFICFNCAGVHRQLGTHISRVRSISLDDWTDEEVEAAEGSGNKKMNLVYEGNLKENPASEVMIKPIAGAHGASRQRFVREKYAERTYYSTPAYYRHIHVDAENRLSPSKSPGRRTSLMVFLKHKDGGGKGDFGFGSKSVTEGTLSTAPETSDVRSLFQPVTKKLYHSPVSTTARTVAPAKSTSFLKRASIGPLFSPFGKKSTMKKTPIPVTDMDLGIAHSKESDNSKEIGESSQSDLNVVSYELAGNQNLPNLSKHDEYRDPRRIEFNRSKQLDYDIEEDEQTAPIAPAHPHGNSCVTPKTLRRHLVATKSMPSTPNSRLSLYSKSRVGRGRSSSRVHDKATPDPHREESAARVRDRPGGRRGRSKSARNRDSSVDIDKGRRHGERRQGDRTRTRTSRSPSKVSTRTRSPSKSRKEHASHSPRGRRQRSTSRSRKQVTDNATKSTRDSSREREGRTPSRTRTHRSPSKTSRRSPSKTRRRSPSSTRQDHSSSSGKPASVRSYSRARERSSSRHRDNNASMSDFQNSTIRESASKRAARERSRSRGRLSSRRIEDRKSEERSKPLSSRRKDESGRNNKPDQQTQAPLNDALLSLPDEKPTRRKGRKSLDGNTSVASLSLESVFSVKTELSTGSHVSQDSTEWKTAKYVDAGDADDQSFQVISSALARKYSFGTKSRSSSRDKLAPDKDTTAASEKFVQAKRRLSRSKMGQISARRSSRKSDIFASLDREEDGVNVLPGSLMRELPGRTRSGDNLGGSQPLVMRAPPQRSRSGAFSLKRVAPKLDFPFSQPQTSSFHGVEIDDDEPIGVWPKPKETYKSKQLSDFEKSFSEMAF